MNEEAQKCQPAGEASPAFGCSAPLPWRFDDRTRNVVAFDGTIVCRAGDCVCDAAHAGPLVVAMSQVWAKLHRWNAAHSTGPYDPQMWKDAYYKGRASAFRDLLANQKARGSSAEPDC